MINYYLNLAEDIIRICYKFYMLQYLIYTDKKIANLTKYFQLIVIF